MTGRFPRWFANRTSPADTTAALAACRGRLLSILKDNIVPFWMDRSVDPDNGGYRESFGPRGELLEQEHKTLIAQARMLYFWSRLARSPYLPDRRDLFREAAANGYLFLVNRMRDEQRGGFFNKVSVDGARATDPSKDTCSQAFALFAIAEYCRLTQDPESISLLAEAFETIDAASHDPIHGGYTNIHDREWTPIVPLTKAAETHLHLLEALTAIQRVVRTDLVRDRLAELLVIQSGTVISRAGPVQIERFDAAWRPLPGKDRDRIAYGHNIENIWFIADACDALGWPFGLAAGFCTDSMRWCVNAAYDRRNGGFFFSGKIGRRPGNRLKVWWVQAEALVCALKLFAFTSDRHYVDIFLGTLDFVERHIVDWEHGEWKPIVSANGSAIGKNASSLQPTENKGDQWKQAYHNGRAMIECLDLIDRLAGVRDGPGLTA